MFLLETSEYNFQFKYCDGFALSVKLGNQVNPLLGKHIPSAVNSGTSVA
jgi:hypothetical protein